jgi:hypothetical protein
MIGWCGIEMYEEGWRSSLAVDPLRTWSMDTDSDGKSGIVSVPGWTKARKRMSVDEWFAQSVSHKQIRTKFDTGVTATEQLQWREPKDTTREA